MNNNKKKWIVYLAVISSILISFSTIAFMRSSGSSSASIAGDGMPVNSSFDLTGAENIDYSGRPIHYWSGEKSISCFPEILMKPPIKILRRV